VASRRQVILLAGLQGAGKTTTAAKLAKWLIDERKKKSWRCHRRLPSAAIEQLKTVSEQAGASSSQPRGRRAGRHSAEGAGPRAASLLRRADRRYGGRLAIDEAMMGEVAALHAALKPIETLFVVDSMLGQDAVNTARPSPNVCR